MLSFEPYTLDALKRALPWLRKSPYRCSDLSAGALFMWQEGTDVQFCLWHDTFMVRQTFGEQPAFSWPYGADSDGMIDELLSYVRQNDLPLRFFALDDKALEALRRDARLSSVMAASDRRWSDYLYSFEDAATFKGRKFSGQRNHINKFRRLYGEPEVRALQAQDLPAVEAMLDRYAAEHEGAYALERMELSKTRQLMKVHDELGMPAACLVVDGVIAAVSIGEVIGDMLLIHVEKALKEYEGAYPTMYQGFVRLMEAQLGGPLRLVNREDDSGDPGLRTSKQQYQPIGMVDKYLAHVHSPAAQLKALPVLEAGDIVLTPMNEGDRAAYLSLNTDVENNRWWGYDYREDVSITGPVDEDTFYDSVQYDMRVGDSINFAIRLRQGGQMIGEAILWQFTFNGGAELGCRLMPEYLGKGYGKAAFGALADFGERTLGLKVVARCYQQNLPSCRMILGNGFELVRQDDTFYYFERKAGKRCRCCMGNNSAAC